MCNYLEFVKLIFNYTKILKITQENHSNACYIK